MAVSVVQPAADAPLATATVWRRPRADADLKHRLVNRQAHALMALAEFKRFPKSGHVGGGEGDVAVTGVNWYDAVAYCNWLSEQEDIPKEQWCYEPNDKGEYAAGMKPAKNYLELAGYRLPTEAEWEFACRAGTTTAYAFGDDPALLRHYAWYDLSAKLEKTPLAKLAPRARTDHGLLGVLEGVLHGDSLAMVGGRLKPNEFGLFDLHGNVWEWCDEPNVPYPTTGEKAVDDVGSLEVLNDQKRRVLRGGAFFNFPSFVRSAYRRGSAPPDRFNLFGFRVASTLRRASCPPCRNSRASNTRGVCQRAKSRPSSRVAPGVSERSARPNEGSARRVW